jgi:hypothetical protein
VAAAAARADKNNPRGDFMSACKIDIGGNIRLGFSNHKGQKIEVVVAPKEALRLAVKIMENLDRIAWQKRKDGEIADWMLEIAAAERAN